MVWYGLVGVDDQTCCQQPNDDDDDDDDYDDDDDDGDDDGDDDTNSNDDNSCDFNDNDDDTNSNDTNSGDRLPLTEFFTRTMGLPLLVSRYPGPAPWARAFGAHGPSRQRWCLFGRWQTGTDAG